MIVFLIPVRHETSVEDYEQVWGLLNNTLLSIASQDHPAWHIMVCANKVLPIASVIPQGKITFIEHHRNRACHNPSYFNDPDFDAHLVDKAQRRRVCVERTQKIGINPSWYFMADADDYVSTDLVSTILTTTENHHGIVTLDTGIILNATTASYVQVDGFNEMCGTSIAMRGSLVHSALQDKKHTNMLLGRYDFHELLAGKYCSHSSRHSMSGIPRAAYVQHEQNYGRNLWDYSELLAAAKPITPEIRARFTLPQG